MKNNAPYKILLLITLALCLQMFSAAPCRAQSSQWAVKMFSEMGTEPSHNFGSVALHAKVEHHFLFKNVYNEDVAISSVSSNCGCTKATATKSVIHPNEVGEIVARVDTSGREHTKKRKATIKVLFSRPSIAEVQLQVHTYIRPDVGFEPGVIEFGTVKRGASVVKKAYLQYEGRPDWALTGIQKTNPGLRAEAREVKRQGGSVVYEILIELKNNATPGYINDLLKFQTNDRELATASVFLPVQGLVAEPISVKPGFVQLGVVQKGERVVKNVVISGSTPFKILDIRSSDSRLSFQKTGLSRGVHVAPITFEAGDTSGEISSKFTIFTDLKDDSGQPQQLTIEASGFVVGEGEEAPSGKAIDAAIESAETSEEEESQTSNENVAKTSKWIPVETDNERGFQPVAYAEKANENGLKRTSSKNPSKSSNSPKEIREKTGVVFRKASIR